VGAGGKDDDAGGGDDDAGGNEPKDDPVGSSVCEPLEGCAAAAPAAASDEAPAAGEAVDTTAVPPTPWLENGGSSMTVGAQPTDTKSAQAARQLQLMNQSSAPRLLYHESEDQVSWCMTKRLPCGRDPRASAGVASPALLAALAAAHLFACRSEAPLSRVKIAPQGAASAPVSTAPLAPELVRPGATRDETWPPKPPPGTHGDFCTPIVTALDDDACYVLPDTLPRELLLYLHGIVPPQATSAQKTNYQTVVANASRRAGVAALLPRGRPGLAPKGHDGWWGWPSTAAATASRTNELVAGFVEKRRKLEALIGRPFERFYVAGSSSGAYFVAALALNGVIAADGFGAMSGGAFHGSPSPNASIAPFYVGYGTGDTVAKSAQLLANQLRQQGWPVDIAPHALPHGAAEIYLDEAIAFWRERGRAEKRSVNESPGRGRTGPIAR
jgi:predicted esterase